MFRVNLLDLDRNGPQTLAGVIDPDSEVWTEAEGAAPGPLRVEVRASATASGQVMARGRVEGETLHECRRCLAEVRKDLSLDLVLVWAVPEELEGDDEEDPDIRALDPSTNELDLEPAIREEVLLAIPRFVLCREDCQGLCPRCGIDRNKETCDCTLEEPDPRWDALRSLQNE